MAGETEVERLLVRLVGDASDYQKMLRDAETAATKADASIARSFAKMAASVSKSLKLAGESLVKFGRGVQRVGRAMALSLTAPIVTGFGAAVKAFADFDKAMIESTSIMSVTAKQTKEMRELATELGSQGVKGPAELAEAYFFLASAGKNAEQSMALLPPLLDFATAGAFDLALATDLLTDAQSALGLSTKDVAQDSRNMVRLSDMLVGANTLANASVQQFSTALTTKAGAAIKAYNIDLEDGVALLAAYADQGIKAELAGNALDRIVRLLTKAQADNSKVFEKFNVNVFNAQGEFNSFRDIIGDIERATAGMSTEMKAATLTSLGFEARVQGVILPLLGASDSIGEYSKRLKEMGGITSEVAQKQLKAFSNQLKIVKNQILSVAIDIGEILSPKILALTDWIKEQVKRWKELDPVVKEMIVNTALMAAVIGPVLIAFGALSIFIGAATTALGALIGPAGVVIAAIVAIGIGIAAVVSHVVGLEKLKDTLSDVILLGKSFVVNSARFIANFRENIGITRDWLIGVWKTISENVAELLSTIAKNVTNNFFVLVRLVASALLAFQVNLGKQWLLFFAQTLPNAIKKMLTVLVPVFEAFLDEVKRAIKDALNPFRDDPVAFGQNLIAALGESIDAALQADDPFSAMLDAWKSTLEDIEGEGGGFRGLLEGFTGDFSLPEFNLGGKVEGSMEKIGKAVLSGLKQFVLDLNEAALIDVQLLAGDFDFGDAIAIDKPLKEFEAGFDAVKPLRIPVEFTTAKFVRFGSFEDLANVAEAQLDAARLQMDVDVNANNDIPPPKDEDDPTTWLERIFKFMVEENERLKKEKDPFVVVEAGFNE